MSRAAPAAASDLAAIAGLMVGAAVVIAAVGVRGDFPLSDDWSYAYSARALCTEGTLRFLPWTGASLVLQSWYGAALCRLFGFSFDVLRLSTLALATSGAIGFFLLLGAAGVRGGTRTLATVLFALDPLYLNLSFTFMTDVPCTVAAVWAGYCYVRGFASGRRRWLVAGALCAAAALLIRQHGIFVAGAAAVTALVATDRAWRDRVLDALAAGAIPVLVALAFHAWLFAWHGAPGAMQTKLTEAVRIHPLGILNCAFRGAAYLGVLLAPLAVAARPAIVARHPRRSAAVCTLLTLAATLLYLREGATMFYLTNVMYDLGLGASTLRDTLFLALRPPVELGPALSFPLTVVAVLAAGILAVAWTDDWRRHAPVAIFLATASLLLFLGTLLHTHYYFDRYLVLVVPFAIAAICVATPMHLSRASVVLTAVLAGYAIAGTHDYLGWNRARYAGLATLGAAGIPPTAIDGGMEFNAWHLAAELGTWPSDADVRPGGTMATKSWWWVVDDRFVASFRPLPGYTVRESIAYARWLPPGTGHVVILERGNGDHP